MFKVFKYTLRNWKVSQTVRIVESAVRIIAAVPTRCAFGSL